MSKGISQLTKPDPETGPQEILTAAGSTYRKPLHHFGWRDLKNIIGETVEGWSKHNAPRLGAALGFYTLLSIAPLLLILVSVVGFVFGAQAAETGVIRQIQDLVGTQGAVTAKALLAGARNTTHGIFATIFGLAVLLFGASGVLVELRDALNTIWDVPTPQLSGVKMVAGFIKDRLFSFALVLAVGFLLVVSLAVTTWIAALGAFSAAFLPAHEVVLQTVNFLISFAVVTGLFAAIYKVLPDLKIEWRDVLLGAAVTSVLFTLGKFGLSIYLGKATFASAYGAAASFILLMVWVYYSAQIFFLGAEFTKIFASRYGSQPHQPPATPNSSTM